MHSSPQSPLTSLVFWIIWFSILSGLMMLQFFIGGGIPTGGVQGNEPVIYQVIAISIAAAALFVRFIVIPRIDELSKKLPAMIIGLALAEGVGIIGMFVVPQEHTSTRLFMLGTAIVCIVLSAPTYAKSPGSGSPFRNDAP